MTEATSDLDPAAASEVDVGLQVSVAVFGMELLNYIPHSVDHVKAEVLLHKRLFLSNIPRKYSAVGTH